MNPSPTFLRWFERVYFVVSVLLWPVTTIISTAYALKLKIPALRDRRRQPLRDQAARGSKRARNPYRCSSW
jgi:hypothetical protein